MAIFPDLIGHLYTYQTWLLSSLLPRLVPTTTASSDHHFNKLYFCVFGFYTFHIQTGLCDVYCFVPSFNILSRLVSLQQMIGVPFFQVKQYFIIYVLVIFSAYKLYFLIIQQLPHQSKMNSLWSSPIEFQILSVQVSLFGVCPVKRISFCSNPSGHPVILKKSKNKKKKKN